MMTDKAAWQAEARERVEALARTRAPFTANDVWRLGLPEAANGRWMGGVIRDAQRRGVIAPVTRGALSERGHGSRMLTVWVGAGD